MGNALEASASLSSVDSDPKLRSVFVFLSFLRQKKIPFDILYDIFFQYGDCTSVVKVSDDRHLSVRDGDRIYLAPQFNRSNIMRLFCPMQISTKNVSKDQGWSSYPNEHGKRTSNTWGCLSISTVPDFAVEVYRNIHAGRQWEDIHTSFSQDSEVVNKLDTEMRRILSNEVESFEGI